MLRPTDYSAEVWRVLVTGSRDLTDRQAVNAALDLRYRHLPAGNLMVVTHGANRRGADRYASDWADCHDNVINDRHPANWHGPCQPTCKPGHRRPSKSGRPYCPAAGDYRNQEMVDLKPRVVLAFFQSGAPNRGTRDCADRAYWAGLNVVDHPSGAWERPSDRRRLRTMTQDSIDMGLYDLTLPEEKR